MPRGDGTGPNGMGPMTGRQAGFCAGYNVPGFANGGGGFAGGFGRGYGMGRGGGRGRRNRQYMPGAYPAGQQASPAPMNQAANNEVQQRNMMLMRKNELEAELAEINNALDGEE